MTDTIESFPLVLSVRDDGSVGKVIDRFNLQLDQLTKRRVAAGSDPLGLKAMIAGLSTAPLQKAINDQAAAENSLAQQRARANQDRLAAEAALAQQQARDSQQRVADVQREFEAAMDGIRARQAAQTAAFETAEAQGNALIALDKQRVADSAAMVAAPSTAGPSLYFNPVATQAAAAAARAQAAALEQVAAAAHTVATASTEATAADRAFALTAREAATAAGAEATRLEELSATQGRVSAAAVAAGGKFDAAGQLISNSVRGQRFATIQASQQFQDFFIQIQGGQNVLVAFTQQASQLAFVMAGAGGAAGKFANFIAGPWGTLIFVGLSALSLLTSGLFNNQEEQKAASKTADEMARHQAALAKFIDQTTGAIKDQNKALLINQTLQSQKDAKDATKQYQTQRKALLEERAATSDNTGYGIIERDPRIVAALNRYAAGGNTSSLSQELFEIGKADPGLKATTTQLIAMTAALTETARKAVSAQAATKLLLGDDSEKTRKLAFGDFSPDSTSTSKLRAAAESAALDEGTGALKAAGARRAAALKQLDEDFHVKGGQVDDGDAAAYQAKAQAIEATFNKEKDAIDARTRAASEARATAKRVAGEQRQELLTEAVAIGNAGDAIKAANSIYAAQITRLRDQLREGQISQGAFQGAVEDATRVRDAALDAAKALDKLGAALIRDFQQFDGEATFVDQIQKARADLALLQAELDKAGGRSVKIGGVDYSQADHDRGVAENEQRYLKPITDANRALQEQAAIDAQILAGHPAEADFLQRKFQILQTYGVLTDKERVAIEAQLEPLRAALALDHQRVLAIDALNAKQQIQLDYLQNTKTALQDMAVAFAKGDIKGLIDTPGKLLDAFQQMQGQKLFENLFGQQFRDLEDQVKGGTGLTAAADKFAGSVDNVTKSSDAVVQAFQQVAAAASAAANGHTLGGAAVSDDLFGLLSKGNGAPPAVGLDGKTLNRLADDQKGALSKAIGKDLVGSLQPILAAASLGSQIGRALGGSGGASIGGGLGGLLQLAGDAAGKGSALAGIISAAGPYAAAAGLVMQASGALFDLAAGSGKKKNVASTGIFGLVGGLLGGLFATTKRGGALVTSASGSPTIFGNDTATQTAAGSLAGQVQQGLSQIASQLGAALGNFAVSIGYFGDSLRVDTSGYTGSLDSKHAPALAPQPFATEADAIQYAIIDAIKDGAIKGIHQGSINLLEAGKDLDTQLQKALSFEQVFKDLKARTDPVGAAIDTVDAKFDTLRATFAEAGASADDLAKLEQLYGLERADAVKQAQQQLTGALQDLLDSLTYKGDTGLSLRTRESAAAAAFDPLAATVRAGGKVDQDAFTAAAQAYLDIERQIFGSSSAYFDKLAEITGLTSQAIANAGGTVATTAAQVTAAAQAAATPTTTAGTIAATTTGGVTYTGVAANDNASLAAAIAQTIAVQTAALQIPPDRVAQFTAAQLSAAIGSSPAIVPAGSNVAAIPTQAMAAAMELQISTLQQVVTELEQQTATLTAQLSAVNRNLGTMIENGMAGNDRGYVPIAGNF